MSKSEKRWNRIGKDLNWDRRPDGSHQAPPQAVPILIIMVVLMFALMIVAPSGLANTKGDAGAIGTLIFLGIGGMGVLLVIVGHNYPISNTSSSPVSTPNPVQLSPPPPPRPPIILPALKRCCEAFIWVVSCRWVSTLPEWSQPILWGLGMALPIVFVIILMVQLKR